MFNWRSKKSRRIISIVIIAVLCVAMIVPLCISVF